MKRNMFFKVMVGFLLSSSLAKGMDSDDMEVILEKSFSPIAGEFSYKEESGKVFTHPYQPSTPCEHHAKTYNEQPKTLPYEQIYEEKILKRIKLGEDGRMRVVDTSLWPYIFQGQLSLHFPDGEYGGSGLLVGPHHVLTAAHNVYSHDSKAWVKKAVLRLALNENAAPFGENAGIKIYTFKAWVAQKNPAYDLALIVLDRSIGLQTGWCGIIPIGDQELQGQRVNITGYPGDKGLKQMWTMSHVLKTSAREVLFYDIDTFGGQSGSGIVIDKETKPYVIGIHTLGEGQNETGNSGVRLSPAKVIKIIQWIKDSSALQINLPTPLVSFTEENIKQWFQDALVGKDKAIEHLQRAAKEKNPDVQYYFEQCFRKHTAKTKEFFNLFKHNICPPFLNVSHLNMGDEDIAYLVEALSLGTGLQGLNVGHNQMGNTGLTHLVTLLNTNTTLTDLNLENNYTYGEGIKTFSETLSRNNTLKTLNMGLKWNHPMADATLLKVGGVLNWYPHQTGSSLIASSLKANESLTSLNFENSALGDDSIKGIFNALENNSRIISLSLRNNYISDQAVQSFPTLPSLTHVDLTSNNLTDQSMKIFFKLLPKNIKKIVLKKNKLNNIAPQIAPIWKEMAALELLDMSDNYIDDQAAEHFIVTLRDFPNINFSLDLQNNKISDQNKYNLRLLKIKHKNFDLFL